MRVIHFNSVALVFIFAATLSGLAQKTPTPAPSAQSTASGGEQQEPIKVLTEEVRIPVFVTNNKGHFDPTLEKDELLVLEDGVPQEITSARYAPASVLLLINTSGELNPAMKTNTSKELAVRLVSRLNPDGRYAVLQYGGRVEAIQNWTTDRESTIKALQTKLSSLRGAHLAEALQAAAAQYREAPAGNRHLVLITDGVEDSATGADELREAVGRLLAANVTVHVISYSQMGRRAIKKIAPLVQVTGGPKRRTVMDIVAEVMDPLAKSKWPPIQLSVTIDLDFEMRRQRDEYEKAMRDGEQWLTSLAMETAGTMLVAQTAEEMLTRCEDVARAIGSQYVVTYRPRRPLASATAGEYRQIEVIARRIGLNVRTRRGYVVASSSSSR